MTRRWAMPMLTVLAVITVGCASSGPPVSGASAGSTAADATCTPGAAPAPGKPVPVTLWHFVSEWQGAPALKAMVEDFNRSQDQVRVTVRAFKSDDELAAQFLEAARAGKGLPDVVQLRGDVTRAAIDGHLVVPVQACLDAHPEDLADVLPQTLAGTRIGTTQWGLPLGYETAVLLYDTHAFEQAGLDPRRPPATLAELHADAQALAAAGVAHPMAAWWPDGLLALSGVGQTDADSGHAGTPTRATFDTPDTYDIVRWAGQMWAEKLLYEFPPKRDWTTDLAAIARGESAMTIHGTMDLKDVTKALAQGQAPGISLAVAAVPSLHGPAATRSPVEGAFLTGTGGRATTAWRFLSWFESPAQQARWARESVFLPIRRSAAADSGLQARWAQLPGIAAAWNVVATASATPQALVGPLGEITGDEVGWLRIVDGSVSMEEDFAGRIARANARLVAYARDPLAFARCAVRPRPDNTPPPTCP